jgi:CheY-like chemotaxis protein
MLAQQMQGDITVSSILGQGSVFTLNVSIKRAVEMTHQSNVVKRAPPRTKLRVLIAEDNRTNMMIARKMLAPCVADLKEAVNGREAVDMFSEIRPDLVLMDVSMAQMDGITATRAIRAVEGQNGWPRTIIVALTAYSQPKETKHCLDAGMDLVLTKPLVRADLYDLLESIKTKEIVLTFPPDMG